MHQPLDQEYLDAMELAPPGYEGTASRPPPVRASLELAPPGYELSGEAAPP